VYKTVGNLAIRLDVHRPDDGRRRPVAVWIHGGALINGHREGVSQRVNDALLGRGYAVASIDYRLAPETKLPEIIADVEDAFTWIRANAEGEFSGDASRLPVLGGSAGGYLTLVTGYRVEPRPAVLVPFWGYGDVLGDWYTKPSPHARHRRIEVTREQALAQVNGPPVADSRDRPGDGGLFYAYCRQQGVWPQEVSGFDPRTEAEKFTPYLPVKNVTRDYPPTFMVHGTNDTDVPFEQSVLMAEQLKKHGVRHELASVPDAEHGLADGDPQLVNEAYHRAFAFLDDAVGR
jgi:acetyl esterase/lipase